jgi:hypothetical protein
MGFTTMHTQRIIMRLQQAKKRIIMPHSPKEEVFTLELKRRRLLNPCLRKKHSILFSSKRSDSDEISQF